MKISFFYRTVNEYNSAETLVSEVNGTIRKKIGYRDSLAWVQLHTKYTLKGPRKDTKIPKNKPGKKKYIATIRANKHKMDELNIDLKRLLSKLNFELVPNVAGTPEYTGETSEKRIKLMSHTEFRAITSVFNKAFGHGNWRINGPKHLQQTLKNLELTLERPRNNRFNSPFLDRYGNGVSVKIVIYEPNVDIDKYLFKVKLKA